MYGGSGTLAGRLAVQTHAPAPLAEVLEQLDLTVARAGPKTPRRARERLPHAVADLLDQEHLSTRMLDRDPRGDDARVVDDAERVRRQQLGQLAEDVMRHLTGRARVDEQPRCVPALGRLLRDQLGRQVVVELARLHPVRTVASLHGTGLRSAKRSATGLREEAAPLSRRVAEVKGLSNNTIRRLARYRGDCSSPSGTPASTTSPCSSTCSPKAGAR